MPTIDKIECKIAWLDDELQTMKDDSTRLEKHFKQKYNCSLKILPYRDADKLMYDYNADPRRFDIVFLDILLKDAAFTGVDVSKDMHRLNPDQSVIFLSANLKTPRWRSEVKELENDRPNVNSIELAIPPLINQKEYYRKVDRPLIRSIAYRWPIFNYSYDHFLCKPAKEREALINRVKTFSRQFVKNYFEENREIDWIVIGREHEKILKTGHNSNPLTLTQLTDLSEKEGIVLSAFQRPKDQKTGEFVAPRVEEEYIKQRVARSLESIQALILEVHEDHVLMKCLLDEDTLNFEVRRFDIEPLEKAVSLEINNVVEIRMITYAGEIRYVFQNGDTSIAEKFENRIDFNLEDYRSHYKPPSLDK